MYLMSTGNPSIIRNSAYMVQNMIAASHYPIKGFRMDVIEFRSVHRALDRPRYMLHRYLSGNGSGIHSIVKSSRNHLPLQALKYAHLPYSTSFQILI